MRNLQFALKASGSTLALVAATYFPTAAVAQDQAADNSVEQVVVTGTSIRGATAPVGSNLITLGQQDIQNTAPVTVTEALANVPAITGMNNSGRGQNGNGGAGASVYIHEIGASAQNSTLVLMDGHRLPVAGSGNGNPVTDPNLIPEPMLQRVEVLADGSSSVYGSDAVSGVVNFITRKEFNGVELHYQGQAEDGTALGQFFSVLTGQNWDHGGFVAAYTYSFEDNIKDTTHWQTDPLLQPQRAIKAGDVGTNGGTTSFGTFNCDPATLQPGGSGNIYYSAAAAAGVSNTAANAPQSNNCYAGSGGNWAATDYLPSETRQNAMIKFNEQLGSSVTFEADAVWETKRTVGRISRGSLTATAFGSGSQANPFYALPAGYTGTATKETIRYDFDALLGPGATTAYGDDELMGDADLTWNINDDWSVDFLASGGRSDSFDGQTNGTVNQGLALLALNGTNQTSGSLTTSSIAGINGVVTNLPLTTANALDVWNPAATNRTSPAVLASLVAPNSNSNLNHGVDSYEQFRAIVNGTLFTTAAGAVKIAGGLERYNSQLYNYILTATNIGPTSKSAGFSAFNFGRTITSEFLEADIPVVSPDMDIPLVRKLEFDLSARHDGYNDVGQTTNPKVSLNWDVVDGFRLRSSWSTSFVAVALEHDILNGQVSNASVTSGT
ncbi:MAG TPA: TonB-dependent receptor plug domain-containing protein, partial [Rhizomicrobium sp.]|nr:TonB-dependent receptor plug domain-containing protein [Rhizomicrobium sp.]